MHAVVWRRLCMVSQVGLFGPWSVVCRSAGFTFRTSPTSPSILVHVHVRGPGQQIEGPGFGVFGRFRQKNPTTITNPNKQMAL